ncbi:MAG: NADH-quinone oxidoreductase subunit C [Gammaproteobacteria bacterium]|nr:NADH-quinone oxidoreductase subunit C [Gammaproteobacteria bacterium]
MTQSVQNLAQAVQQRFADRIQSCTVNVGEVTVVVAQPQLLELCQALRDEPQFGFDTLIDLCGVDYLEYGAGETGAGRYHGPRFAVVYHLLSVANNQRLRVRVFLDDQHPRVDSVITVWNVANWYEREAFDLFGIMFNGHPDLRRLLTDYGFIGHPFRKDFPLIGNVEMRYDPQKKRVVYEPVSIEPRINVPRVIREDHRYMVVDHKDH